MGLNLASGSAFSVPTARSRIAGCARETSLGQPCAQGAQRAGMHIRRAGCTCLLELQHITSDANRSQAGGRERLMVLLLEPSREGVRG